MNKILQKCKLYQFAIIFAVVISLFVGALMFSMQTTYAAETSSDSAQSTVVRVVPKAQAQTLSPTTNTTSANSTANLLAYGLVLIAGASAIVIFVTQHKVRMARARNKGDDHYQHNREFTFKRKK